MEQSVSDRPPENLGTRRSGTGVELGLEFGVDDQTGELGSPGLIPPGFAGAAAKPPPASLFEVVWGGRGNAPVVGAH